MFSTRVSSLWLIVLLLCCCYFVPQVNGFKITLDAKEEACFLVLVDQKLAHGRVEYQVFQGSPNDISVVWRSENTGFQPLAPDGPNAFDVDKLLVGEHQVCFQNNGGHKTISFDIHVGDTLDPALEKLSHDQPVERSILRISNGIEKIRDAQKEFKTREMTHRAQAEKTNENVQYWGIIESITLLIMSGAQLWYIQRLFQTKRVV
eukprot:gb/GECH01008014.1/.p1 GENE.gb/GECH01008014.1/~~gb/GECH01008014.1/.p1  ORF type:complete len:205 (+),score=41.14 gb/GECH01008014.1/:1-615(+)